MTPRLSTAQLADPPVAGVGRLPRVAGRTRGGWCSLPQPSVPTPDAPRSADRPERYASGYHEAARDAAVEGCEPGVMPSRKPRTMAIRDVLGRLDPSRKICGTAVVVKLHDAAPPIAAKPRQQPHAIRHRHTEVGCLVENSHEAQFGDRAGRKPIASRQCGQPHRDPLMMFVRRHEGRNQRIDVEKPRSWEVRQQFADLSGSQRRRAGSCLEHRETSFTVEPQRWWPWRLADRCEDDAISLQRYLQGRPREQAEFPTNRGWKHHLPFARQRCFHSKTILLMPAQEASSQRSLAVDCIWPVRLHAEEALREYLSRRIPASASAGPAAPAAVRASNGKNCCGRRSRCSP